MVDMNAVQLAQEQKMRERGRQRAERAQARADTAETPAGIQLAKKAVAPLTDAIRAFLAPSKGAGRRHTAAKLLEGVDPELAAYITVRSTLGYATAETCGLQAPSRPIDRGVEVLLRGFLVIVVT